MVTDNGADQGGKGSKQESRYKASLNLPQTNFPMKGNLPQREPGWVQFWNDHQIYHQLEERAVKAKTAYSQSKHAERPYFILQDGPPYANGDIHIGHAVNKILKDIVLKSKRLNGFPAAYIPGWDCHGLPIELQIEKKHGKRGTAMTDEAFVQKCCEYADQQIEKQKSDFIRLGVLGNWDKPYKTNDPAVEANTVRAIGKILERGDIYCGYKPVYWSVATGSALAEAEVEYRDKVSDSIDVRYKVIELDELVSKFGLDKPLEPNSPVSVLIWTTTPWTLPSSLAVAMHPDLEYALVEIAGKSGAEYSILAEELIENLAQRWGDMELDIRVIATTKGKYLEQLQLHHPFYDRVLPVILAQHVTTDAGTGCVHTAPDHGPDDFNVAKSYGIPVLNYVDDHGLFREGVRLFAGEHVHKVNDKVLELLRENDALFFANKLTHSYPHCWRTKTPLIFRATSQWFMKTSSPEFLEASLSAVDDVTWVPEMSESRIRAMLDSSPDWCLSRQRIWGTPIPFITHVSSGELHPRMIEIIETAAQMIEKDGIMSWHKLPLESLIGDEAKDYKKCTDTLDVWFDSGALHWSVGMNRPECGVPADVFLEGSDQHRGWFQTSLKTSISLFGRAPYREVITHGFVVDGSGKKMSKSLGNVVAPSQVLKKFGADVLRLWVASTDYAGEMAVSDEILNRTVDAYRRIRNTLRFILANLHEFSPETDLVSSDSLLPLDAWLVSKTTEIHEGIVQAYNEYNFLQVIQRVHHFCNIELGSFYLDIIKDRQYTCKADSVPRRSAQSALYHCLEALVRWISPVLSFTAEEVWRVMPGARDQSVMLQEWYEIPEITMPSGYSPSFWRQLIALRGAVNKELEKVRREGVIKGSLDATIEIACSSDLQEWLAQIGEELRFILQVSKVEVKNFSEDRQVSTDAEGMLIRVTPNEDPKCERCWHRQPDVGQHEQHETICGRCVENINGAGEKRSFG